MPRALVILPTETYRAGDFVDAAAALGIELSIASERPLPLAATDRAVTIDCARPEWSADRIADLAATTPIDAIVAADDAGVVVAALAAERIGLPHNPPPAAEATRDKLAMRRALADAEVPQPRFAALGHGEDAGAVAVSVGLPAVIKPISLSASRGVIRVDDEAGAREAAARIRRILADAGREPDETLVVERFVPGREVSVEGVLRNGELEILATFDKPDPLDGPYFEETIFVTPSSLPAARLEQVHHAAGRATRAIGLTNGPVHAELRVDEDRVQVVEVAARTIGGLCGRSLRFGLLGTPLEVVVLRQALGMSKRLPREPGASGVMMLPIPRGGILRAVGGAEEARAVPGIVDLEITIPVGGAVVPLPEGDRYLGFLFARGDGPDEVVASLRSAHAALRFDITPEH